MTADLAGAVRAGDRRALARAITLVESLRDDDRERARALFDAIVPDTGRAIRLGISGTPGVGKSTLIEALGVYAIDTGRRVAVLAVDPSSTRNGGSILGDKTRMSELSRRPEAFIRPSPTRGTLGGVTRRTREALLLCEAAGFDVVIIETVGVGQSEVAVSDLVDLFVLVASPAGGDELQGVKRGIMELADIVVVNKADGELLHRAQRSAADLRNAIHLLRPKRDQWVVPVLLASATQGSGIPEVWHTIVEAQAEMQRTGELITLRGHQSIRWMWDEVNEAVMERLRAQVGGTKHVAAIEAAVASGDLTPTSAAHILLASAWGTPDS